MLDAVSGSSNVAVTTVPRSTSSAPDGGATAVTTGGVASAGTKTTSAQ